LSLKVNDYQKANEKVAGVAGLEADQQFIGFPSKLNYSNEINDFLKATMFIKMNQAESKNRFVD